MKITMLGFTSSGKTTYLSALLGLFYQGSVDGFSFRVPNNRSAEVNKVIDRIDTLNKFGVFPDATVGDITKLSLELYKNNNHLIDFEFIDYRGGALNDIAKNENTDATIELETTILASDVVLVFVDAVKLNECRNDNVARNYLGVLPITTVLSRAKEEAAKSNKKIRIVFVLTKTDASTLINTSIQSLKTRVKSLYSNLYLRFGQEADEFKIYDIGTVGKHCVQTNTQWKIENGIRTLICDNQITDMNFRPFNIAAVFAQALLESINNSEYSSEILSNLLIAKESNFGKLRQLFDILFNKSSRRLEIRDIKATLEESRRNLARLKSYNLELIRITRSGR